MSNVFDVSDKVAWITGASWGGLGYFHAKCLAEAGAHIIATDLPSMTAELAEANARLESNNVTILTMPSDVTSEDDVQAVVNRADKEFGRLDVLVNNAGIGSDQPALDMPLRDWNHVLNVNLTGSWLCAKAVCHFMVKKEIRGKIINIASIYGRQADVDPAAPYYATKAAIINLTRALAAEWARYGINVNAIGPGYFPTRMTREVEESPELKRRFMERIMLHRPGNPETDLRGTILLLASNASDYITGQTIFVDGGWTAV